MNETNNVTKSIAHTKWNYRHKNMDTIKKAKGKLFIEFIT